MGTGSRYFLQLVSSYTSAARLRLDICGLDNRHNVAERVNHVSGSRFKKYNTFDEVLKVYTMKYNEREEAPSSVACWRTVLAACPTAR